MRASDPISALIAGIDPTSSYMVPIVLPRYVFGSTMWDLNLWDAMSFTFNRDAIAEFTTEDLLTWFGSRAYKDGRNGVRKAFVYALEGALKRGLVRAAMSTGKLADLASHKEILDFFRLEERFRFLVPGYSSAVSEPNTFFYKPRAYLENGWAAAIDGGGTAVLNLLLYNASRSQRLRMRERAIYDFLCHGYMARRTCRTGIRQLVDMGLARIDGDYLELNVQQFGDAPRAGQKSHFAGLLKEIWQSAGVGADPWQVSYALDVLRAADLLRLASDNPRFFRVVYKEVQRWLQEPRRTALLVAARRWSEFWPASGRWERIVAYAVGLRRRVERFTDAVSLGRFQLSSPSGSEVLPLLVWDLRRMEFDGVEVRVRLEPRKHATTQPDDEPAYEGDDPSPKGEPTFLGLVVEDGEGRSIVDGSWSIKRNAHWISRLDATGALTELARHTAPEDVPLLCVRWHRRGPPLGQVASAELRFIGARYRTEAD